MHFASTSAAVTALLLVAAACGNSESTSTTTGTTGTGAHASGSSSGSSTGGSPGTGGAGGSALTAEEACAAQAKASCEKRDACSNGYQNKRIYGDTTTCESRTTLTCVANLGSTGDAQSPAKIAACTAVFGTYTCPDFVDGNPPTACVPPAGTGATGAACGAAAQCASTYCATAQNENCGTCQPLPAVGDTCQVQADCGRDLACAKAGGAAAGKCAAWGAMSAACLTGVSPCGAGLGCVGEDVVAMTMGTCQANAGTVGAACDGSRKTMPTCDAELGLACIPTAKGSAIGTCQAIQLVAAGAACGNIGAMPITGLAACAAGGLCKKAAVTDLTGTCVAAAADGAACDSDATKGPPCLTPAKCVSTSPSGTAGTCISPDAHKCM